MIYNRLDNSPRSKWAEQVHMARHEYAAQCKKQIDLMVVEELFVGISDIARWRLTAAILPVLYQLGRIKRLYGSLDVKI